MNISVVDFEEVLKNFNSYHESLKLIQAEKDKFTAKIEDIKKEMETIVNSSRLIVDESNQRTNVAKFKELQNKAITLENEFRSDIVELQNTELENNFKEVSKIVQDWAVESNVDIVLNKTQTLFVADSYDVTTKIIDVIKSLNLYKEYDESLLVTI